MSNNIIDTERHGLWIVAAFVLALLAFSMSITALVRIQRLGVASQLEVLALNKHIDKVEKAKAAPAPAAPASTAPEAAPAAPAK